MTSPSIYLDECVDLGLGIYLEQRGLSVTTVQAAGTTGMDDEGQLDHAARRGLMVLSHNQRHFQRVHGLFQQQGRSHGGILLVPQSPLARLEIRSAMMLDWISTFPDYRSQLFRWNDLQYRMSQGGRLPGYSDDEIRRALGRGP